MYRQFQHAECGKTINKWMRSDPTLPESTGHRGGGSQKDFCGPWRKANEWKYSNTPFKPLEGVTNPSKDQKELAAGISRYWHVYKIFIERWFYNSDVLKKIQKVSDTYFKANWSDPQKSGFISIARMYQLQNDSVRETVLRKWVLHCLIEMENKKNELIDKIITDADNAAAVAAKTAKKAQKPKKIDDVFKADATIQEYKNCFFTDSNCTSFVQDLQDKMVAFMNKAQAEWLKVRANGAKERKRFVLNMAREKRDFFLHY